MVHQTEKLILFVIHPPVSKYASSRGQQFCSEGRIKRTVEKIMLNGLWVETT